jgi:TetR/AcrR family transcriptional regulator, lmrAB and yxaGH operons repressor
MSEPANSESGTGRYDKDVRARMVTGALRLLATKGLEGTTFGEVLEATGAPRGSVYHHFPGGKVELLHAALDMASDRARSEMEATRGLPPAEVVGHFLVLWRILLERSQLTAGCAVVAVTVAANDEKLLNHAGAIFRSWTELLADLFTTGGIEPDLSWQLATTVIASTEGAVAICRAERSLQAFEYVESALFALVERFAT